MIATSSCNAAKDIVSLFANGERVTALRLEMLPGVARRTAFDAIQFRTWKHVEGE